MFLRYIAESFRRAPRRKAMTVAAVAMGTAVATAMLGVMLDIGDKVNLELRAVGANILVTPRARAAAVATSGISATPVNAASYIPEDLVPKIKSIFWTLNIAGFAPSLTVPTRLSGREIPVRGVWFDYKYKSGQTAGVKSLNPAWKVTGRWPQESGAPPQESGAPPQESGAPNEALAGAALHIPLGTVLSLFGQNFTVVGVLAAGTDEDSQLLVRLHDLQPLVHLENQVDSIQVAALTKPEDAFARRDPATMNPKDLERWNCTNYVRSIARQIEEALPMAVAKPVWRVADSEGRVLSKISGLMMLVALAALAAAGLTVWSVMATTVMERRGEIAIMQATGASNALIRSLFAAEVGLEGLVGGILGVAAGLQLARWVGRSVFGAGIEAPPILAPLAIAVAVMVAVAGAMPPLRRSLAIPPALALRERI